MLSPSVVTSRRRPRRRTRLAETLPERREEDVRECVHQGLCELSADVALDWVDVIPRTWRRGRRIGYMVEIACRLPTRRSDLDPEDPGAMASFVESQVSVALLSLCRRLRMVRIRIEPDSRGELYCIAYLWVAALKRRQTGRNRTRLGLNAR
jgi:hypothetical protein